MLRVSFQLHSTCASQCKEDFSNTQSQHSVVEQWSNSGDSKHVELPVGGAKQSDLMQKLASIRDSHRR